MGKFKFLRAAALSIGLMVPPMAFSAGLDAPGVHIGGDASTNSVTGTGGSAHTLAGWFWNIDNTNGSWTFNNGFTSFNGKIVSQQGSWDPVSEYIGIQSIVSDTLTTGDNQQDVLNIQGQMATNPHTFHQKSHHNAGVYGHSYGAGDNAAGIVDFAPGVVGMASNQGLGTVVLGASFLSHIPAPLVGGSMTTHYAFYDEGCTPGVSATTCYGASFLHNVGVGTAAPTASFDDRLGNGINTTGTYKVSGTQIAATNLSNGVTGSGSVVLSDAPVFDTAAPAIRIAGGNIAYLLFQADVSTTIGRLGRPNNRNSFEVAGYDSVVLKPALTAAGMVEIGGGATSIASGACGTTTNGSVSGNNNVGLITIGAATTTACAVSFSGTVPAAPLACVFSPATSASAATTHLPWISAISTTGFTLSGTALASTSYYYHCI